VIPRLPDLDATAVLTASEALRVERREREVDDLRLVLQWADIHSVDPGEPRVMGSNQLVRLGGDGTPLVQELCWAELAVAREAGVIATERLAADALDLRHRLPLTWAAVCDLTVPAWVGRKVASMSRALGADAVGVVDVAVAEAAHQSPARILAIAEAKVIEADIEAHRAKVTADAAAIGVRLSRPRAGGTIDPIDGEPATRRLTLKLPTGLTLDAHAAISAMADAVQDRLPAEEAETITRGELEAKAIELLIDPRAAVAFLDGLDLPPAPRRAATVFVHLSQAALAGLPAVARVEDVGPLLLDQLSELLGRRDIALRPVIDLNHSHAVSGYEHPTAVKQRTVLRMIGDAFPHSSTGTARVDHDHCTPYHDVGPPGQTGDHNDAPLSRKHHRVKTHQPGWRLDQLALGAYRWVSPHGLGRMVTPSGTRRFEPIQGSDGAVVGEWYDG